MAPCFFFLFFAHLTSALAQSVPPAPVGMLTRLQGSAQIEGPGGRTRVAELGAGIYIDSVVRVRGSASLLFCPTRSVIELKDGVFRIRASGVTAESGTVTPARAVKFCSVPSMIAGRDAQGPLIGGTTARGRDESLEIGSFALTSPLEYQRVPSPPEFYWKRIAGATGYKLELHEGSSGTVVWERELSSNSITYSGVRPLAPGRYRWQVTVLRQTEALVRSNSTFQIVPSSEADGLKLTETDLRSWIAQDARDVTPRVLLGTHLEGTGHLRLALAEYQKAMEIDPSDALRAKIRSLESIFR